MVPGEIFLYLAFIFGLFSLILLWQAPFTTFLDVLRPQRIWFMRLSAVSLTLAVLLMAYYLITSNFSINYVYSYTSLDLAPIYKLSALWTGEVGSLLFFGWVLLLIAAYWYERHQERGERSIILVLGLLILLITISMGPFASTLQKHPDFLDIPQDGLGLNPLLVNIWMIFTSARYLYRLCFDGGGIRSGGNAEPELGIPVQRFCPLGLAHTKHRDYIRVCVVL